MMSNINISQLAELTKKRGVAVAEHIQEKFDSVENLCKILGSSSNYGLKNDPIDISRSRNCFGQNVIPSKPPKTFIRLFLEAFDDRILLILLGAAIISFGVSFVPSKDDDHKLQWIESLAIVLAVFLVVFVTAVNDYQKEKQFQGLYKQIGEDNNFTVIRDGKMTSINVADVVVGDLCSLKYGDLIPADGVIVYSSDLKIDESSLTGESDMVKKSKNKDPLVLSGTHVMEGSGTMLVVAVGLNSQSGIIATLLGVVDKKKKEKKTVNINDPETRESSTRLLEQDLEDNHQSVLQSKLSDLTLKIGILGVIMALLTTFTLLIRFCVETFVVQKQKWNSGEHLQPLIGHFITGVTVLVVALPEGLPLAVTLSLAYSVKKMVYDNNLVRHLDACETMGSATTICSDKTGTLTTNRMTVVELFIAGKYYKYVPSMDDIPEQAIQVLSSCIAINSAFTSVLIPDVSGMAKQMGNKTECALLGLLNRFNINYENIRNMNPTSSFHKLYTFNSDRKFMSTVVRTENSFRLYCKGATEIILLRCNSIFNRDGNIRHLKISDKDFIFDNVITVMTKNGLRTLCLAYRDFPLDDEPDWDNEDFVMNMMTCVAIAGIEDPIRDEVPNAIAKVKEAGIVVRMVTGDNINTARSIAIKCGIISQEDKSLVLDSKEFNKRIRDQNNQVNQELLDKVWPKLMVLARSSPTDKFVLINGIINSKLHKNRQVVAVTGDGTNDAPALKKADVGFAMGMAGTDVAKEASDIIITDDNFSSIVKAVMWGRNVYDSISKFLKFQLTVNVVAVIVAFVGSATSKSSPLSAIQMLWVNLIMDTFASLALATEKPTDELLKRRPYGRTKALISKNMMKSILGHAVYQLSIIFIILYNETIPFSPNPEGDYTIIFNVFVLMTLMNEINCRKIHGERNVFKNILKNPMFFVIWIATFFLHVIIVQFGTFVFKTRYLNFSDWMICLSFGIGSLLWEQILIFIPTNKLPRNISLCKKTPEEIQLITEERHSVLSKSHGHILWLRSANRIRSQLRVIRAFNELVSREDRDRSFSNRASITIL